MYLERINKPQDIKGFSPEQRKALAGEMRDAMLKRASIHGGHFGPDFGIVEAVIALHTVFDSPKDKIVFDVSHQAYPHKMLTGLTNWSRLWRTAYWMAASVRRLPASTGRTK